jgi:hypothetical protein
MPEKPAPVPFWSLGQPLRSDAPHSLRAWTLHWGRALWPAWSGLREAVRTGANTRGIRDASEVFERLDQSGEPAPRFQQALGELARGVTADLLGAFDFAACRRIVDVGGGSGTVLAGLLQAHPHVQGVLFDRPAVIAATAAQLAESTFADRIELARGDFFQAVPTGGDVYLLKSVLHDWSDERAIAILTTCRRAMPSQATLLVMERLVPDLMRADLVHQAIAVADLNLLVTLGGRERTEAEFRTLLTASGFTIQRVTAAGPLFSIIQAVPNEGRRR